MSLQAHQYVVPTHIRDKGFINAINDLLYKNENISQISDVKTTNNNKESSKSKGGPKSLYKKFPMILELMKEKFELSEAVADDNRRD